MKFVQRLLKPRVGRMLSVGACLLALASATPEAPAQELQDPEERTGRAILRSCDDPWGPRIGSVFLRERPSSEGVKLVDVLVRVRRGLEAGQHALHIHETGECSPCSAAKGHFDPGPNSNSSPDGNHPFHAGDLINLTVDDSGHGNLLATTSRVTLSEGPLSVFDEDGSAFIVHVDPDTYCSDGEEAGCAGGARAACGIIRSH